MNRRCFIQMGCYILVCLFLTISTASARVCFLPDSTDCGEGDVAGSGNVDVPCQYSSCPSYNTKYQTCYTERIYNNGGVNVECKQVKCSLSKSDCEKKEADPNSSQCCNFDSASGCYYMGSCKLCNRDVYDSEKNLGEGYDCHPCKDKNGTFYNCTAKEKECKDINSKYTSSCGDSQIAKEVEGIKDSHGNQCYTCEDKPAGSTCKYKHAKATLDDTHGIQTFDPYHGDDYLYDKIQRHAIESVSYYKDAENENYHLYNKISKDSKTCYDEKNTLRYETICTDPSKAYCDSKKGRIYTRTCTSEGYNVLKLKVESMEFGTCVCDLSKQLYETNDDCMKAHESQSLKCTKRDSDWCYQTCEDAGMYSSEDACMTNAPKYTKCNFNGSCYIRSKPGWGFHYTHGLEKSDRRRFKCTSIYPLRLPDKSYSPWTASVYVEKSRNEHFINWEYAKDLIGDTYPIIEDQKGEVRYPAGEYLICVNHGLPVASFYIAKTNGDACAYRSGDNDDQWHADENNKEFCSNINPNEVSGGYSKCLVATFEDYEEYYVHASMKSIDNYNCYQVDSAFN